MAERILHLQEEERTRVARELHDGIVQLLAAARFQLEGSRQKLASGPAGAGQALEKGIVLALNVLKSSPPEVLLAAIQGVLAGLLDGFEPPLDASPAELLTDRELEVATLCASDFTDKGIANQLNISVRTVEKHRQNIARKLRTSQPPINPTPIGLARWLRHWGLHEDSAF